MQPIWITPAGNMGVIPEGIFFEETLFAVADPEPFMPTVTATNGVTNRLTCTSTAGLTKAMNVMFMGNVFGGLSPKIRYFVLDVFSPTEFSIGVSEFATSPVPLLTATGEMTAEFRQHVYFFMLAGQMPPGIQCSDNGLIIGVPKALANLQGVPYPVSRDITYEFAIRGYTKKPAVPGQIYGQYVLDQLADRTFTLTITGQDTPDFVTPAGLLGTYYDGTEVDIQLQFTDPDPDDQVIVRLVRGELPPGLVVTRNGLITGAIRPLVGPPGSAEPGNDDTPYDEYPNDFTRRSTSQNFQFTLEVTDGKDANIRTFEIYVYSKDSMTADTTDFTADNTFITADVSPQRTPVLLTPEGDLGRIRADNYFAFKFDGVDFDGDALEYSITTGSGLGYDATLYDETGIGFDRAPFRLPPGLTLNPDTGWLYGYIPDQGATENTYQFAVRVLKRDYPQYISGFYYYSMTIIGNIDTEVVWLTEPDLGTIDNGAISMLKVEAVNVGGRALSYRLVSGSNSKLPQGLTLQPSGNITGRVSFNTFALDGGTTTFDVNRDTRLDPNPTTFDLSCSFDVNAYSAQTEQLNYEISAIVVINGGSGFTGQPTITIEAPPETEGSIQATAGLATIQGGVIQAIDIGNPGRGYTSPPRVTITGGGGSNAVAVVQLRESGLSNAVSVIRRFTVLINRVYNEPYQNIYVKCMPGEADRDLINRLIQNQDIIPENILYRPDDPNFGVAKNVTYYHALGLSVDEFDRYVEALSINHYWRNVTLGGIRTARALDANDNIVYEVVYSPVIDDLVNAQGVSAAKQLTWPTPIVTPGGTIDVVYPGSLINMRDQLISVVGRNSQALPLWMTSKQANGTVLGFQPCWVLAYVKPGESGRLAYNISTRFGEQLNLIDFKIDRYELDRSQTYNWSVAAQKFEPSPPEATTFDRDTTIFDGRSTRFIAPADRWTNTDAFDKYLVFPRTNILG